MAYGNRWQHKPAVLRRVPGDAAVGPDAGVGGGASTERSSRINFGLLSIAFLARLSLEKVEFFQRRDRACQTGSLNKNK